MLIMAERITVDDLCQEGIENLESSKGEHFAFLESGHFNTADASIGDLLLYRYRIGNGIFQMTEDAVCFLFSVHLLQINGISLTDQDDDLEKISEVLKELEESYADNDRKNHG